MSDNEPANAAKAHIEWIYAQILERPQIFCRVVAIETYIVALEGILDVLSGSTTRPESYQAFLAERQFGMRRFESIFETREGCVLSLVAVEQHKSHPEAIVDDKYAEEFKKHWGAFLEWRLRHQQGPCGSPH